jgi:hypothetical protein
VTTHYAVWHGTPDLMAALLTTTRSLTKAQRIVAKMTKAGQPAYITREHGCLMDKSEREVVT